MCLGSGLLNALVTIVHVQGTITEILLTLETLTPRTNAPMHARFAGSGYLWATTATRGRDAKYLVLDCTLLTVWPSLGGLVLPVWLTGGITAAASDLDHWLTWYKGCKRMFHNFLHIIIVRLPVSQWYCECDVYQVLLWFLFHNWLVWRNVIISYCYTTTLYVI